MQPDVFTPPNEKVSVLISLYINEKSEHLRESLDSIFSQTRPADEVMLVEDGPVTEALEAVVNDFTARHKEMKVVRLSQNHGLGAALQVGLQHCSYDLVARMDTDDISKPERLEKQVTFMAQHPEIDVLSAWIEEFLDSTDHVTTVRKVPENHDEIYAFSKHRNPMNHPVSIFRKHAVEAAGGYQPIPLFEDYDLWVRMLQAGSRMHNLQMPLLLFRMSPDTLRRRGGWSYACQEMGFEWKLLKTGYIGLPTFLENAIGRFLSRITGYNIRKMTYKHILRTQAHPK